MVGVVRTSTLDCFPVEGGVAKGMGRGGENVIPPEDINLSMNWTALMKRKRTMRERGRRYDYNLLAYKLYF